MWIPTSLWIVQIFYKKIINCCLFFIENNIFATGCKDGSIKVFDKRLRPHDAKIASFIGNHSKILNLRLQNSTVLSAR